MDHSLLPPRVTISRIAVKFLLTRNRVLESIRGHCIRLVAFLPGEIVKLECFGVEG